MNELTETKELIFDAFVELCSAVGYENVSVRDIAKKVGINVSSIYYHYESKDKILENVYEYYIKHYFDNRKPVEFMKRLIETADAEQIIGGFARNYLSDDEKKYIRMVLITKITYMRLFQDEIVNRMFSDHNTDDAVYVTSVLNYGVEIGRIYPDFDTSAFASLLIGSMIALGVTAFASPDYTVQQFDYELRMHAMLAKLLATGIMHE